MGKWDKSCCDLWQLKSLNSKAELEPCCHLKPGGTCITHPQLGDMFSLPPSWPAGLAHQSSWKPAFGNVSFIRARQAQWHLERTAASRYTQQQTDPNKKLPLKNAALAALQHFAELHMQATACKKPPESGKREKPKPSNGFPLIAFLRLLFHISSKCIKNNFTETLRTGNKTCCLVQTILEAVFDSHNSHWKVFICAWIKIICFGSNKRLRSALGCSGEISICACFQIHQDVQESSGSLVTLPALILTLHRALEKKKKLKSLFKRF